jgi:hypothetical protein
MELVLRITNAPCGFTAPSHDGYTFDRTTPFVIVSVSGTPRGRHLAPGVLPAFDDSRETPTYLPSNAVVGAGACAATGVAKADAGIAKSIIARPNMFPSSVTC